jgi:hypothetical protein
VHVELNGLAAPDVAVQLIHGGIDSAGDFVNHPARVVLSHTTDGLFTGRYEIGEAGPYGVTARVVPANTDLTTPLEMGLVAWAY